MKDDKRRQASDRADAQSAFADGSADSPRVKLTAEEQQSLDQLVLRSKSSAVASSGVRPLAAEDVKALPRLHVDLVIVAFLCLAFQAGFFFAPPGLCKDLWVHLPIQLYWTFCLYRICQVTARKYDDESPLSDITLAIISVVSFACMPMFDHYHFEPRWLDPFFWCWAATQFIWPAAIGLFLEKKEHPERKNPWLLPLTLSLGTNAYIILGLFFRPLLSISFFFNPIWFVSQFWCILFLCVKLREGFGGEKTIAKREPEVRADGDMVVRYRAFAAIERWIQQRLRDQSQRKAKGIGLIWFAAPLFLIAAGLGLLWLGGTLSSVTSTAASSGAAAVASQTGNSSFIAIFLSTLAGLAACGTLIYLKEPTHLALGANGLRFLWRHKLLSKDGVCVGWRDINHITVVRPAGKTSPLDYRLCFVSSGGKPVEIKMGAIEAVEDRELVLKGIRKWAPTVSRDASVEQLLQPPADYSYTELWLQALSAPPKRERLQPLLPGIALRNERYKVLQTLGAGGQGQAYLAEDALNRQKVVLKEFILPVFVDVNVRRAALEQFENEARILKQLEHPQIVKMIDFFVEDHRAYLVLEHIQGASLREIVKNQGPLSERRVRMLASQMCDILSYLHNLSPPVVHRDFTPDNLILNVDGTLKLIDFNVAKQSIESATAGTVVGKHAYLPPEQFRGLPEPQSDIYAMGGTLFYLLTGQDPEPIAVSHPRQVASHVSESLSGLVERATALSLDKRFHSIGELKESLREGDT